MTVLRRMGWDLLHLEAVNPRRYAPRDPGVGYTIDSRGGQMNDVPLTDASPELAEIPVGLWLRGSDVLSAGPDAPLLNGMLEAGRCVLLVGEPGEVMPAAPEVAKVARSLHPAARNNLLVIAYGREPDDRVCLAQHLADLLSVPVRARHGLTVPGPDGAAYTVVLDGAGVPAWRPFVRQSCYRPGRSGANVEQWFEPVLGASEIEPGSYRLTQDWSVDVVPAGLVVRRSTKAATAALRCGPVCADRVDLVLDVGPDEELPDAMLTALSRFADALAPAPRSRLQVVLPCRMSASALRSLHAAVPAPQQVDAASGRVAEILEQEMVYRPPESGAESADGSIGPPPLSSLLPPLLSPLSPLPPLLSPLPPLRPLLPPATALGISSQGRMMLV